MQKNKIIYVKYRISILVSAILFVLFLIPSTLLAILGEDIFPREFSFWDILFSILGMIFLIIIHEIVHFLAFLICGIKKKSIQFGFNIKKSLLYCHATEDMLLNKYRFSLILPFIITGIIPFILSIYLLNFVYIFVVCLAISTCAADILLFLKSFKVSGREVVKDHPFAPGFYLINQFVDDVTAIKIDNDIRVDYLNSKSSRK